MTDVHTCSCLCGAVRFSVTGPLERMVQCHCTDCQKTSGGGPAAFVMLPRVKMSDVEGETGSFTVKGTSGGDVTRHFCPACGTPLFGDVASFPDLVVVKVGAFDLDPGFAPQIAIWTRSAAEWHVIPDGMPTRET